MKITITTTANFNMNRILVLVITLSSVDELKFSSNSAISATISALALDAAFTSPSSSAWSNNYEKDKKAESHFIPS